MKFLVQIHSDPGPYFPASCESGTCHCQQRARVGHWTFKATYRGQTFEHRFSVGATIFDDGFESGDTSA